jgi:hypothetical protein
VTQVVDPEFKSQYQKNKNQKKPHKILVLCLLWETSVISGILGLSQQWIYLNSWPSKPINTLERRLSGGLWARYKDYPLVASVQTHATKNLSDSRSAQGKGSEGHDLTWGLWPQASPWPDSLGTCIKVTKYVTCYTSPIGCDGERMCRHLWKILKILVEKNPC